MILFMIINCLNPASVNGAMLNLNKRKEKELDRPCVNMLQYSNDEMMICFWQQSLQIHKLDSFLE